MANEVPRVVIRFLLNRRLAERLRALCFELDVSVSQYLRELVIEDLEKEEDEAELAQ